MANYAVQYVKKIEEYLKEDNSKEDIIEVTKDHLLKIQFFQHERLVHLIVTVLFALLDMIIVSVSFFCPSIIINTLVVLFTVLLIPYVFHYYFLENSVQKMYKQYDKLRKLI